MMVTRKPVPVGRDHLAPKRSHSGTTPLSVSERPQSLRTSSDGQRGLPQIPDITPALLQGRQPTSIQDNSAADGQTYGEGEMSLSKLEDTDSQNYLQRHKIMAGTGRDDSERLTPKSSWESLADEKSPTAAQKNQPGSPHMRSTNPFRRAHSPSDQQHESANRDSIGMNTYGNAYSTDLPSPARFSSQLEATSNSPPTSKDRDNRSPIPEEMVLPMNDSLKHKVPYSHGLEELVSSVGAGSSRQRPSDHQSEKQTLLTAKIGPTAKVELDAHSQVHLPTVQTSPKAHTGKPLPSLHPSHQQNSSSFKVQAADNSVPSSAPPAPSVPEKVAGPLNDPAPSQASPAVSSAQSKVRKASETYQIRLVNWFDASSNVNPRRSPNMVQNANGPCPLLALVNALVLSTPATVTTALVETLRVREQVSLGLLLDAVIDELMSGRRGNAAQNLPDVSDLYAFLVNLHTGMNVNPCFLTVEENVNLMDAPIDQPSTAHDFRKVGGFEETREMKLYSTFAVPLIHGWISPRTHPAFEALKRRAKNYEDAQNLLFREEELEEKLQRAGLSAEEQYILQDISSIKYFLSSTATQLTGYGLDTVTETLAPGALVIFFRNDHFSTLYRHPHSGQLLTLVTDMGYAGHDEVVWESLVDVSGEGSEFYSGDFRPVGNLSVEPRQATSGSSENDGGWTTVNNPRSRKSTQPRQSEPGSTPGVSEQLSSLENLQIDDQRSKATPPTEQQDHDLALAMQLQEEEEERERQAAAARRREDELSRQYLDNADAQGRRTFPGFGRGTRGAPDVPPRGGGGGGGGRGGGGRGSGEAGAAAAAGRVLGGRGTTSAGGNNAPQTLPARRTMRRDSLPEEAPPPTYEQAAKGPAYHPPADPLYNSSSPVVQASPPRPQRPRGTSAYSEHAALYGGSPPLHGTSRRAPTSRGRGSSLEGTATSGRRRNGSGVSAGGDEERKERECIVM